jgi:hypothetical protein
LQDVVAVSSRTPEFGNAQIISNDNDSYLVNCFVPAGGSVAV